jgi:hypothetical protein
LITSALQQHAVCAELSGLRLQVVNHSIHFLLISERHAALAGGVNHRDFFVSSRGVRIGLHLIGGDRRGALFLSKRAMNERSLSEERQEQSR